MSLHGGKDQSDRESTITDFKSDVCNVLVATSVAARGLDVRDLHLVVNYDVPNHHEDYVHRVGRTGRAGNKGTAVTFIAPGRTKSYPHPYPDLSLSLSLSATRASEADSLSVSLSLSLSAWCVLKLPWFDGRNR